MSPFEALEDRRLMSVSLEPTTRVLTLVGGYIHAEVVKGSLKVAVTDAGSTKTATFLASKIKRLVAINDSTGSFNDTIIKPSVFIPAEIFAPLTPDSTTQGGSGADTIHVRGLNSVVHGGAGGDTFRLYDAPGSLPDDPTSDGSAIYGEGGNDRIIVLGGAPQENGYDGGTGNDLIDYSSGLSGLLLRNGGLSGNYELDEASQPFVLGSFGADTLSGIESFVGTQGDDYLYGNQRGNTIDGQSGNDQIRGGGGNDTLIGGPGRDALFGDAGNDRLFARDGEIDFLSGGTGVDDARRDASDVLASIERTR
ncbi:calcium-binding protein [Humisphaera borealis]|uniref:Calcium-binding protein n=1 Tax=Humisphaera borealis TaxID=2807512 RepID=A0A7M2X123_9BACT|nr:calcium-binding protein [Humisphaera borealis]QOV91437.1 hypothetical protein IPV69_08805 [Humisphaera borealis]